MTIDLAADSSIFVADFGETVTVAVDGEADRDVVAVVNRTPFSDTSDTPYAGHQMQPCHLMFRNSDTLGLTPEQAAETTKIKFAAVLGEIGSDRLRPITRIIRQNFGMVLVEVNL